MHRRQLLATALAAAAVPLSACGTTDPAAPAGDGSSAPTTGTDAITVTDGAGKKVTLPKPATKVVALEWGQVEDVVTLGVQPVGVADVKGYDGWVSSAKLTGTPKDVGLRSEPSVESVANVAPDLILGIDGSIPEGAMKQMEEIAPVVLLKGADATRPVELLKTNFETTAKLLGRESQAATVLSQLDTKILEVKTKINSAGHAGAKYVFAYPSENGNQVSFRMHSARSLPGAYAALVGLKNAWTNKGDAEWGLSTADVEALTKLPDDTTFLYWGNTEGDAVTETLTKNAVWKSLGFVKAGRVVKVAEKIWVYGGPASMMQWLDNLAGVFAK